jgi:hypothetical protein
MDNFSATEQAYKNGYEKGRQDALKWIPVTERLPEAWVDVLSCDRNKNLTVDCVDKKGKWYSEYKNLEEVTHWMPLPSTEGLE